ncbi:MAG: DUF4006 family protein [Epsilonproteobacteria bacterium]|nr:DUF4006 family protein [Campylobacterota bacterium]
MAENTKRSLFGLDGITGMLIATGLLLAILFMLVTNAIMVQRVSATKAYDPSPVVNSLDNVKMKSTDNAKYAIEKL